MPKRDQQRMIDFRRTDQLRILRDCELKHFSVKQGQEERVVTAATQKALLRALDDHGRECFASLDTLSREANLSRRQVVRVLEALELQGLVVCERDHTARGYPRVRRLIVFTELALLCGEDLASRFGRVARCNSGTRPSATAVEPSATAVEPSATAVEPSATAVEPSATAVEPSAHPGTVNELNATGSDTEAPTAETTDAERGEADVSADGARWFFTEELAGIRVRANRLHERAPATTLEHRQLLLKLATLWHDGRLADDAVEQVLESFQRKRVAGDPVRNPIGWLWTALANQCRQRGGPKLEQLLATTDFPAELVAPAGEQQEARP